MEFITQYYYGQRRVKDFLHRMEQQKIKVVAIRVQLHPGLPWGNGIRDTLRQLGWTQCTPSCGCERKETMEC